MSQSYTSKAVGGFQWGTASMIFTTIMHIGYTSVMSRLLDPKAFGLIAVAQIIINFGGYFSRLGMTKALIQKKEISNEDIRAVFTSSLILSCFFTILFWFLAPFSSLILQKVDDEVVSIIRLMSLSFLINGFATTSRALLTRQLKFKLQSIQEVSSFLFGYILVGISSGILGMGVWSLVLANLSQLLFAAIFSFSAARHNVVPTFNYSYHQPFLLYGSKLSSISFLDFIGQNIPPFLIGLFFGDYLLGIFRQAYMIITLPLRRLAMNFQHVLFPMYSAFQFEKDKLKNAFLSSSTLLAAIILPIGFSMSVASKEIVLVVFGDGFIESYPILRILSIGICFKFVTELAGIICDATAKLKFKFIIELSNLIILIIAAFSLKSFGLIGFAWILTINELIRTIAYMFFTRNFLQLRVKDYVNLYYPGFFIGIISAINVYLITIIFRYLEFLLLPTLICQVTIGFITLAYFTVFNPPNSLRDIIRNRILTLAFFENKGKRLLKYIKWYNANEV